jgi:hypothetical protein
MVERCQKGITAAAAATAVAAAAAVYRKLMSR